MKRLLKIFSKKKSRLEPMGVRSIYPFDYNKNNPFADQACERWKLHISVALFTIRLKNAIKAIDPQSKVEVEIISIDELSAKMNMESLVKQAQSILEGEQK